MNIEENFETDGPFLSRDGPARQSDQYSNRKLCFVATDQQLLMETLFELSQRDDCFFVKLTVKARDGMFLGRCFFTSDEVVGAHWAKYKNHPKMMCNVQDDDFTKPYRSEIRSYKEQ